MAELAPRQQQLARITALRTKARHLMSVANHETIEKQAVKALRDLDEALLWLNGQHIVQRPLLVQLAQAAIDFAAMRLAVIERTLADYGPDVAEIG